MADNFDTNVAKRKPSTKVSRPDHPWDVQSPTTIHDEPIKESPESIITEGSKETEVEKNISLKINDKKKPSEKKKSYQQKGSPKEYLSQQSPKSDLSDAININSNYCKLHNDVSDHLFRLLSTSAQSVYLRLYRQSFGWNRNWAAESLPKLTQACNVSLQTVRKAIKELENVGCIKKEFSDYHKATVYRVYLPSEKGIANINNDTITNTNDRGVDIDTQKLKWKPLQGHFSRLSTSVNQIADTDSSYNDDLKNLGGDNVFSGGQKINIQSRYSLGTSIYELLESGGALPKNIYKYITNIHLMIAVNIIDEFYNSIGFSIVSRAQYRKSLIDFFEMIKSGFSSDDIRYAVRWTFKNSRSRPESFSLIKHTMHLAMDDLIRELKTVSGEKELAEKKKEALKRKHDLENNESPVNYTEKDMKEWISVVKDLKGNLNEHSFSVFIEPLRIETVKGKNIIISAPPDSVSWVNDHFVEKIVESYFDLTGKEVIVEVR